MKTKAIHFRCALHSRPCVCLVNVHNLYISTCYENSLCCCSYTHSTCKIKFCMLKNSASVLHLAVTCSDDFPCCLALKILAHCLSESPRAVLFYRKMNGLTISNKSNTSCVVNQTHCPLTKMTSLFITFFHCHIGGAESGYLDMWKLPVGIRPFISAGHTGL